MYKKDGIWYGDSPKSIRITDAAYIGNGTLLVTFSNGEKRVFDTALLTGPVFKPLLEESVVKYPEVVMGTITWNNKEIDVAPEFVYQESRPYDSSND